MRQITSCSVFAAALLATSAPGWTAQTVGPLAVQPAQVVAQTPTPVTIRTVIQDLSYIAGSANLQKRLPDGRWIVLGTMQPAGNGAFTFTLNVNEPTTNAIRLRASAAFRGLLKRVFSPEVTLPVGQVVPPSPTETVITGPSETGLRLTVPPNALVEPALVSIAPALASDITAPLGGLPLAAALHVTVQAASPSGGDRVTLTQPLQLSLSANGLPEGTKFYVAQQVLADVSAGTQGGLQPRLLAVDTATVTGGRIVTSDTKVFAGIFGGGTVVLLQTSGP